MKHWLEAFVLFWLFYKASVVRGLDNAAFVTSEIHRIEERRDLKIECNVSRSPELTVVWKKYNDEGFIVNGTELDLRNISRNESGGYLCYSYNVTYDTEPRAAEVHRYTVGVLYKAGITSMSIEPEALLYNNSFAINCTVDGNPNPEITIFSNETGKVLYSDVTTGVVTVQSPLTGCEDAGVWVCAVSNYLNEGVNASRSENITVFCPPKIRNYEPFWWKVGSRTNVDAYLKVETWSYPHPNYTWVQNVKGPPIGSHYDGGSFSILKIPNVRRSDFGRYWVHMTNYLGITRTYFYLIPYSKYKLFSP